MNLAGFPRRFLGKKRERNGKEISRGPVEFVSSGRAGTGALGVSRCPSKCAGGKCTLTVECKKFCGFAGVFVNPLKNKVHFRCIFTAADCLPGPERALVMFLCRFHICCPLRFYGAPENLAHVLGRELLSVRGCMQLHARPRNYRRNEFLTKLRFDPIRQALTKGN
jgi:hypothetical protein